MKALSLEAPRQFRMIDVDEPPALAPGEALVQVHRVGICGTDISGYLGKMPFFSYPRIPGHELGVEVLAVGAEVHNVKPGDRCAVEPYINCQTCPVCTRGRTNCCENHQTLGVHVDGGLRPRFIVPARKLHLSKQLSLEQLALVETLAIGCHAVDRCGLRADDTCLIIGAGPIGLATLEFVKLVGAKVIMLDLNATRLAFCRDQMNVEHILQPSDHLEQDLRDLTDGHMPDVVIDATGSPKSMSAAFGYVGHGGRLVYLGITTEAVSFRHAMFHKPEGTLYCSRNAPSVDFIRIIRLIEDGKIDTQKWISHRTPFEVLIEQFDRLIQPETGVIKAVVELAS